MDLVVTVTKKGPAADVVDIWRLNGEKVCSAHFEAENDPAVPAAGEGAPHGQETSFVEAVGWRRDGRLLAVACADGSTCLINTFTSKIEHRFNSRPQNVPHHAPSPVISHPPSSPAQSTSRAKTARPAAQKPSPSAGTSFSFPSSHKSTVTALSWTSHFASPIAATVRSKVEAGGSKVHLDQLLGLSADVDKMLRLSADLPHELGALDVEASLPKLATLPPRGVGVDDDIFSSRASVDAIFHAGASTAAGTDKSDLGEVDALLIASSARDGDCALHLRIFDSFDIGAIPVASVLPSTAGRAEVVHIAGHAFLSTLLLVVKESEHTKPDGAPNLHLLSLDLGFVTPNAWNLPLVARKATQLGNLVRYLSQIQTQLRAEVGAAFDLPTRFLRNIDEALSETDAGANFVHAAHILAVLGHCDARFKEWLVDEVGDRGLKRWEKAVGDSLDVVRRMTGECLLPTLERCQVVLSRLDGLACFGPTSSRLGLQEKSIRDVRETVDATGLVAERLLLDVCTEIREFAAFIKWLKWECEVEALEDGSERVDELREAWTGENELQGAMNYVRGSMKHSRIWKYLQRDVDPPGEAAPATRRRTGSAVDQRTSTLPELVATLEQQCDLVFAQIAETFRKSVLVRYQAALPPTCDDDHLDVRVVPDSNDAGLYHFCALSLHQHEAATLHQTSTTFRPGEKTVTVHALSNDTMTVPNARDILDVKFVDDTAFLVLASSGADVRIWAHRIMAPDAADDGPEWALRRVFRDGRMAAGMVPARLEVNGRVGRRVVTVVDQGGMGYEVLDLDGEMDANGDEDHGSLQDEVMTG